MDAVKFLEELHRLCNGRDCNECVLHDFKWDCPGVSNTTYVNKIVTIVEKWSAEHPQKTRVQDFYEKYPNAPKVNGYPIILPLSMGYCGEYGHNGDFCNQCPNFRLEDKKCWEMPVE